MNKRIALRRDFLNFIIIIIFFLPFELLYFPTSPVLLTLRIRFPVSAVIILCVFWGSVIYDVFYPSSCL
jgi:hypothetical protein